MPRITVELGGGSSSLSTPDLEALKQGLLNQLESTLQTLDGTATLDRSNIVVELARAELPIVFEAFFKTGSGADIAELHAIAAAIPTDESIIVTPDGGGAGHPIVDVYVGHAIPSPTMPPSVSPTASPTFAPSAGPTTWTPSTAPSPAPSEPWEQPVVIFYDGDFVALFGSLGDTSAFETSFISAMYPLVAAPPDRMVIYAGSVQVAIEYSLEAQMDALRDAVCYNTEVFNIDMNGKLLIAKVADPALCRIEGRPSPTTVPTTSYPTPSPTASEPTPSPTLVPTMSYPTPSPTPAPLASDLTPSRSPVARKPTAAPEIRSPTTVDVTFPPTSAPTDAPSLTPTCSPSTSVAVPDYCPCGYHDYGVRYDTGLGRITVVRDHVECADRCSTFSGVQFTGGCRGYMTGMYFGMLFCRSYGRAVRATPCAWWAKPESLGIRSGGLGSVDSRTHQPNIGGNCCSNTTFVDLSS